MVHLNIALNIINSTKQIKSPPDFMLGAVAPDSVHFREGYSSDMKFNSHLCVGDEKWGQVTNNDEWQKNVFKFLNENRNSNNEDFLLGYCCHILADIQNNKIVWMPFKESIKDNKTPGISKKYHQESNAIDYELYKSSSHKLIWKLLSDANIYEFPNITRISEIEDMRESLLDKQFSNRIDDDITKNEYVKLSRMETFISEESKYIKEILFNQG